MLGIIILGVILGNIIFLGLGGIAVLLFAKLTASGKAFGEAARAVG